MTLKLKNKTKLYWRGGSILCQDILCEKNNLKNNNVKNLYSQPGGGGTRL